jgi:hypothetical protein
MDERAVRAAVDRLVSEAHGLYLGTGTECRLVPMSAIVELMDAVAGEPGEPPAERAD